MTISKDPMALLDSVYDALNKHDPGAVSALASDNVVVDDVPRCRIVNGRQAVEDHYSGFFRTFPDARYESLRRFQQGDIVVDEFILRGTNRGEIRMGKMVIQPTNKQVEIRGVNVFEIEGGQVRRQRIYYDAMTFARQLGLGEALKGREVEK